MAFAIKNRNTSAGPGANNSRHGGAILDQWIQAKTTAKSLPATTTDQIFRVYGGKVLVRALFGVVTTVIQTQADNLKVTSKRLDNAAAAVGTAKDISANVDVTGLEVGSFYFVEGDGTAGVLSTAGGAYIGPNSGQFIVPQGEIYLTASATNTGAVEWYIFYQPLDPGAYVVPVNTVTAAI